MPGTNHQPLPVSVGTQASVFAPITPNSIVGGSGSSNIPNKPCFKGNFVCDMKMSQLRDALSQLGLNTSGSSKVLRERLKLVVNPENISSIPRRKVYKCDPKLLTGMGSAAKLRLQERRDETDLSIEKCLKATNIMHSAFVDLRILALEHSHAKAREAFWKNKKKHVRKELTLARKLSIATKHKARLARKSAFQNVKLYSSMRREAAKKRRVNNQNVKESN